MNMMNKCAKFHKDSPSDKKVKFNLPSAIELSETAVLCTTLYENLCKRATSVAHLTNFSFEFFYEMFMEDASLLLLYHGAKKSKMTKNSNQEGPAFNQPECLQTSCYEQLSLRGKVGLGTTVKGEIFQTKAKKHHPWKPLENGGLAESIKRSTSNQLGDLVP